MLLLFAELITTTKTKV